MSLSLLSFLSISYFPPAFPFYQEKTKENKQTDEKRKKKKTFTMPTGNAPVFSSPCPLKPTTKAPNHIPTRIGSAGNGGTSTNQACAACKYQRRKCAPDCILAPYFPHDRQRQFLNAHKLFGVSNITKIIKNLDPPEKEAAMHTIIFQSDARANDPVGGCYRIIRELQYQIEYCKAELDIVLQHLAIFRERVHQQSHLEIQETENLSSFSSSCNYNNSMSYDYLQVQEQQLFAGNYTSLQDDIWGLHIQDSSATVNVKPGLIEEYENMKPVEEVSSERHEIGFESEQLLERKLNMPSAQLVISS